MVSAPLTKKPKLDQPDKRSAVEMLSWDHSVNLMGEKVTDSDLLNCCQLCCLPILIYGRMIPCKHVFCMDCAKKNPNSCARCGDKSTRIEECSLGTVFVCSYGGPRHGPGGCRRTYLSYRDMEAHVKHRHQKELKNPSLQQPMLQPPNLSQPPPQPFIHHLRIPSHLPPTHQPPPMGQAPALVAPTPNLLHPPPISQSDYTAPGAMPQQTSLGRQPTVRSIPTVSLSHGNLIAVPLQGSTEAEFSDFQGWKSRTATRGNWPARGRGTSRGGPLHRGYH